ncbi:MAG TPA: hypothetical protein VEF04_19605, partial [Blastocatellia bacterium]|nr:hypothetical protein [Blastocatellia bacterium]
MSQIEVVSSWEEFRRKWTGGEKRQNFLLRGEMFPYQFDSPSHEAIVEAVRKDAGTRVQKGAEDRYSQPVVLSGLGDMPSGEVINKNILIAH